ncbi:hypothetical protein RvY_10953 [Ramazzottius varieornatus]|uniref:Uncharacterized protein n=1 Tax=Ramazzottius varieornatus TaxID=947166 RepID=A0A1D1VMA7_RAMVA|nr:hypothetical protein RvY_10953 [Ramazzottius varieornatus]
MMDLFLHSKTGSLNGNVYFRLGIFHALLGVFCAAVQVAVYVCVAHYSGELYLSKGNLFFPVASLGLIAGFSYAWSAYLAFKVSQSLRTLLRRSLPIRRLQEFRTACLVNIIISSMLLLVSIYCVHVTSFWNFPEGSINSLPHYRLSSLMSVGQAALVFHSLHLFLAMIELIVNVVVILIIRNPPRTEAPPRYEPHTFTTVSANVPVMNSSASPARTASSTFSDF